MGPPTEGAFYHRMPSAECPTLEGHPEAMNLPSMETDTVIIGMSRHPTFPPYVAPFTDTGT